MIKTDILKDIYFGRLCLQENTENKTETGFESANFLDNIEPKLKEKFDEYLSSENLKTTQLEAEAFAKGCTFTLNFILSCLRNTKTKI